MKRISEMKPYSKLYGATILSAARFNIDHSTHQEINREIKSIILRDMFFPTTCQRELNDALKEM